MKCIYLLLLLITSTLTVNAQTTYTWNTGNGVWTNPGNWTPTRSAPASTDRLVFNASSAVLVTGVSSQTIGSLTITGGAQVTLQPVNTNTLNIGNATGTDLNISAGSILLVDGGTSLSLFLIPGATASIGGQLSFTNGQHTLRAVDAGAIHFNGFFFAGPGFTGNPFGSVGTANSVIFESGSQYIQEAGSNPFALAPPASIIVFESGSMCEIKGNVTVSIDGRTYANLDIDGAAANISASGATGFTVDTLRVHQGSLTLNFTGDIHIKGYLYVEISTTMSFVGAGSIYFDGSTPQYIYTDGVLTFGDDEDIIMNNSAGLTIQSPVSWGGDLNLIDGLITTFSAIGTLTLRNTATVTGASSASFINGPLTRETAATTPFIFPLGKAGSYRPAEVIPSAATASSYTAEYWNSAYSDLTICNTRLDAVANNEYWDISKNNGSDAAVRLNYTAASTWSNGITPDATKAITVAHYTGTCWQDETGTIISGTSGPATITSKSLSTFSPFTFGYGPLATLPIHFTAVKAVQQAGGIRIEWSNLTETDMLDYAIERSANGVQFINIQTVNARLNNASRADYSFLDMTATSPIVYYRIKARSIVENKYSLVLKVNTKEQNNTTITVYPNPSLTAQFTLQATALPRGIFTIRVINIGGQQIHSQTLTHDGGSTSQIIQLPASVGKGKYSLMIEGAGSKWFSNIIIL